jgi:hypothetical protein
MLISSSAVLDPPRISTAAYRFWRGRAWLKIELWRPSLRRMTLHGLAADQHDPVATVNRHAEAANLVMILRDQLLLKRGQRAPSWLVTLLRVLLRPPHVPPAVVRKNCHARMHTSFVRIALARPPSLMRLGAGLQAWPDVSAPSQTHSDHAMIRKDVPPAERAARATRRRAARVCQLPGSFPILRER